MRILYVEDHEVFARFVIAALEKLGHTVIHGVGWTSNRPITMMANSDHKSTFEVQEEDFDCAIVDYKLLGFFKGDEIVGYVTHIVGKPCVGCSSDSLFNRQLTDMGAVHCVIKDTMLTELDVVIEKLSQPLPDNPRLVLK